MLSLAQGACRSSFVSLAGSNVQGQAAAGSGDAVEGEPAKGEVPDNENPLCIAPSLDEEESKLVFIEDKSCPKKTTELPAIDGDTPKDPIKKPDTDNPSKDPGKDPAKDPDDDKPNQGSDKPNQSKLDGDSDEEATI